ncbi:fatty acid hydroxylase domain-containing protein 2 [Eurytemora carolleeae]|uniref:fatty acid hydroxylase domain-containing protein 2 n=1 Tax=Eurytemora carolleeae TaxID=1294199 RepID=UPI000C773345|nr:fatty acid hydroxylase domain-containing protein 2 [Eurytemora carolleeae]|eukprot:XP_023341469.1 fatty acid hydroxylase domain-containing protein 2-like [Eurytemora affinis]
MWDFDTFLGVDSLVWSFLLLYIFLVSNSTSPFGVLLGLSVVLKPSYVQETWSLLSVYPERLVSIWIPGLVLLVYWIHGLLLLVLDIYKWEPLYKYKLQPRVEVNVHKLPRLFRRVLSVQLGVYVPISLVVSWISINTNYGLSISKNVPSSRELLVDILGFAVVDEILFYAAHRAAHSRPLYKYVHKVHHEYTAPIALATDYCHPLEHCFVNVLPNIGYIVCGPHAYSYLIWWLLSYLSSQTNHSGYRFPTADLTREPQPDFHDKHHERFDCNFGTNGVLDWLFSTAYKQTKIK